MKLKSIAQAISLFILSITSTNAAEFIVKTTGDEAIGAANLVAPDVYEINTLRAAINASNDEKNFPGPDQITFDASIFNNGLAEIIVAGVGDTFSIFNDSSDSGFGITTEITITGPQTSDELVLSAVNQRHFQVMSAGSLSIDNITLKDGFAPDNISGLGGSILVHDDGELNLVNSIITNSTALSGGAIHFRFSGLANIVSSHFSMNSALTQNSSSATGGAISINQSELLLIESSTFKNNISQNSGGALFISGPVKVIGSTFSNNVSYLNGGAIATNNIGVLDLFNSTVSGNSASNNGGGIRIGTDNGEVSLLLNNTITNNRASVDLAKAVFFKGDSVPLNSSGGGVFSSNVIANLVLHNNLIAGNFDTDAMTPDDLAALPDNVSSNNLIGGGESILGLQDGVNGNQIGTTMNPIDAMIGPLTDNGGPTQSHFVAMNSPAVNAGSDAQAQNENLIFDQRGEGFDRQVEQVDIGALEYQDLIFADGFE